MSAAVAVLVPLALALGVWLAPPARLAWVLRLAPWAPLALLGPLLAGGAGAAPTLLLGVQLAPDDTARPVLWLTAVGWTLAGWFAQARVAEARRWFWGGWLGALAGMHLLLLAGDIASFYIGYATVGLSAYLLVTHAQTDAAWRAGRIYLALALAGEAAILVGVLQLAGVFGNAPLADLPGAAAAFGEAPGRWFFFAGFAIKLGILPLHVWLPLAHPVAPVPASAILSGILVKAGLLGWLRFVPPTPADAAWLAPALVALGLATAFGGVALGLGQARLKTVLAYSTVSQMGLVLVAFGAVFGVGLGAASAREAAAAALGVLVLHHGLGKASLFLACASAPGASRARLALFALPALSLAAAPFTTGFLAKGALKDALGLLPSLPAASLLLTLTSAGTALLLWKAFRLARQDADARVPLHPAWPAAVLASVVVPAAYAAGAGRLDVPSASSVVDAVWPLALAAALVAVASRVAVAGRYRLPEGDVVVGLERLAGGLAGAVRRRGVRPASAPAGGRGARAAAWLGVQLASAAATERRLAVVGVLVLAVGVLLWAVLRGGA